MFLLLTQRVSLDFSNTFYLTQTSIDSGRSVS